MGPRCQGLEEIFKKANRYDRWRNANQMTLIPGCIVVVLRFGNKTELFLCYPETEFEELKVSCPLYRS